MIHASPKQRKRNNEDDDAFRNEPSPSYKNKKTLGISSITESLKSNKEEMNGKSISGIAKSEMKGLTTNQDLISDCEQDSRGGKISSISKGNKLVTSKPWFLTSQTLNEQNLSSEGTLVSDSIVSNDFRPFKV